MRASRLTCSCIVAGALLVAPSSLSAQTPDAQALRQEIEQLRKEFDAIQKQYGDRLTALESKLSATEPAPQPAAPAPQTPAPAPQPGEQPQTAPQTTAQVPPGAEGAGGPTGALPVYGGAASSKVFNPDIAVIGDFLGATCLLYTSDAADER